MQQLQGSAQGGDSHHGYTAGGDFEAVDEVYMAMLDAGHPPDPEFEKEFEVVQQLHRQNQVQQHLDDINGGM